MASAARSSVGCRSGAKDGEWLPGGFWDHVRFDAGVDRADGEYGGVLRIDLAGDQSVQPGDNAGSQQDRIHALVRHGAVGAFAPDGYLGGKGLEPAYASSAGWNTATKVPLQQPRLAAYAYSAPSTPMMWKSCPQAWATCSSRPLTASTCVAEEA